MRKKHDEKSTMRANHGLDHLGHDSQAKDLGMLGADQCHDIHFVLKKNHSGCCVINKFQ